jgi:hypothetical protein
MAALFIHAIKYIPTLKEIKKRIFYCLFLQFTNYA